MNIAAIKDKQYKIFARQTETNRAFNMYYVQYIENMAARAAVNISTWDIEALFKDETKRSFHIIRDKKEINRIFFEYLDVYRSQVGAEKLALENRMKAELERIAQKQRDDQMRQMEEQRNNDLRQATQYFSEAESYVRRAWQTKLKQDALLQKVNNVPNDVMEILGEGAWEYISFNSIAQNTLELATVSDCILTEVNKTAGLNRRVNMGRFKAIVNLNDFKISVMALERNVIVQSQSSGNRYAHPHINWDGKICWGEAAATVQEHIKKFELRPIMRLLATLLNSYNNGSPYMALESFEAKAPQDKPIDLKEVERIEAEKKAAGVVEEDQDDEAAPQQEFVPMPAAMRGQITLNGRPITTDEAVDLVSPILFNQPIIRDAETRRNLGLPENF